MAKKLDVWLLIPVAVEPIEDDPERSIGCIPRDFWVPVKDMHFPPTVGLGLSDVHGVPFISVPPITKVFYNAKSSRYSCHTEPFLLSSWEEYAYCVQRMGEIFGNGVPPEK